MLGGGKKTNNTCTNHFFLGGRRKKCWDEDQTNKKFGVNFFSLPDLHFSPAEEGIKKKMLFLNFRPAEFLIL